ncbi:MAG: dual specificity protein kinase yak1, partial [Pleopsidium flavum]
MEQQWPSYSDMSPSRQTRYSQGAHATPQQQAREFNGAAQQHQPPAGFSYEAYQAPLNTSHPHSMATSPSGTPHARKYNGDGDIPMEDADPYNRMKYTSRPNQQHRISGQYLSQEESSAARRYSPMHTLSPSSPYAASPQQAAYGSYTQQTYPSRQSPTRPNPYTSQSQSQSYHTSPSTSPTEYIPRTNADLDASFAAALRQQPPHLPPIQPNDGNPDQYYPQSATAQLNAVFGREARSPRHLQPQQQQALQGSSRGPVPRFRKLKNVQVLESRINDQPAFRRANPEGGFIS